MEPRGPSFFGIPDVKKLKEKKTSINLTKVIIKKLIPESITKELMFLLGNNVQ